MQKVTVELGTRSYPIFIGDGLMGKTEIFRELLDTNQVMIVTDTVVEKLYLSKVIDALNGINVISHVIPVGETEKNLDNMNRIISLLLKNRFGRTSCLIALGGGVVGDLTGFSAACYQRGISFFTGSNHIIGPSGFICGRQDRS